MDKPLEPVNNLNFFVVAFYTKTLVELLILFLNHSLISQLSRPRDETMPEPLGLSTNHGFIKIKYHSFLNFLIKKKKIQETNNVFVNLDGVISNLNNYILECGGGLSVKFVPG